MASILEQIHSEETFRSSQRVYSSERPSTSWLANFRSLVALWPLRIPRLTVGGQVVLRFGDLLYFVALPWLLLTGDASSQALVLLLIAYGLPRIGSVLLGGLLSDRPGRLLLVAGVIRALACGALAVLLVTAHPALWLLCVLSACIGVILPSQPPRSVKGAVSPLRA